MLFLFRYLSMVFTSLIVSFIYTIIYIDLAYYVSSLLFALELSMMYEGRRCTLYSQLDLGVKLVRKVTSYVTIKVIIFVFLLSIETFFTFDFLSIHMCSLAQTYQIKIQWLITIIMIKMSIP